MSNDKGKQAAGYKAAEFVESGMRVGLGTGSTAFYFIEKLIERCQQGLRIEGIATSKASSLQAKEGGIPLLDPEKFPSLDLDVDGADEIDPDKQMIKGGGGALFREKIIATSAKEMIVVVDESKLVPKLGHHPLPVEISSFGLKALLTRFENLGLKGELRRQKGKLYLTDNGNYILDLNLQNEKRSFRKLDQEILSLPGVIDTGFFWDLAQRVVIGFADGHAEVKTEL